MEKTFVNFIIMPNGMCNGCYYLKKIESSFTLGERIVDSVECYLNSILDLKVGDVCPNCLIERLYKLRGAQ